jgi:hypothetical protein
MLVIPVIQEAEIKGPGFDGKVRETTSHSIS